ncbi:MAG: hypothetical protein COV67_15545 [Nitrospinae bacterium CG11_big_fil_rev_8_21_14_0_20_56_8]|nr:MAG: hypothetical protein COV67_15545 [Nitrospinae bacterium CG11_big_fil_rev_8_21_14_0_20_56_8]
MFDNYTWHPVTGPDMMGFIQKINPIDDRHSLSPSTTKIAWCALPFYENIALIRVEDRTWTQPELKIYYLAQQGELFRLNGTSPPIHEVNIVAPIVLNDDNVLGYLRFFCFFVRAEGGPFLIVEDINNPYIPDSLDATNRSILEQSVRPAGLTGKDEEGQWLADAVVYYGNNVFLASFSINQNGIIDMLDENEIISNLPVMVNAPII